MPSSQRSAVHVLGAVFFFSGLSGLIYQVVWQRLLTLNYGVGAVSITLIVSVFMLGTGLGSLLGGWLAERCADPYRLYAAVEGALGVAGLASYPCILALGSLTAGRGPSVSFVLLFLFLCLPTLLMGVTLPLLATLFNRLSQGFLYSVGHLYFINTLGAAAGALLAGYFLISLLGLKGCLCFAAGIDFVLAAVILSAGQAAGRAARTSVEPAPADDGFGFGRLAYLLAFAAGFIAMGHEITGYRVIGTLVKDSPYAFASILAVYLLGIALGSMAIQRHRTDRLGAGSGGLFFRLQFLAGLYVLMVFAAFYHFAPHEPLQSLARLSFSAELHPSLALLVRHSGDSVFTSTFLLFDVFLWPLLFLFLPAMFMGASFPLLTSLAHSHAGREGRTVGITYFFSVLGNVSGGLVTGFVLLPFAGSENTILILGSAGLLFGLASGVFAGRSVPGFYRAAGVLLLVVGFLAAFPRRGILYEAIHMAPFAPCRTYMKEGLDAVVVTYEDGAQVRNFINGQGHGYRPGPLFYAEAIEGLTFAPSPRNVLVLGFGAGSGTEAALLSTDAIRVTVVELCSSVIGNMQKLPMFDRIFRDRRLHLVIDDGRRFLQRSDERFDVILMDPLRTTTAYSNNLHSRQFFSLAAKHLTPGGILMVGGVGECLVIPRTLAEEFPFVRSYLSFTLASKYPMHQNQERLRAMLGSYSVEMQAAIWSLAQDPLEGRDLAKAIEGYPVNQDWMPVSEYYLGLQAWQWWHRLRPAFQAGVGQKASM